MVCLKLKKIKREWARPESDWRSPRCKRDVITTRPLAHVILPLAWDMTTGLKTNQCSYLLAGW